MYILSLHDCVQLGLHPGSGLPHSADRMATISDVLWTVDSFVSQYYKPLESFETVTGHFASKSNESIHVWIWFSSQKITCKIISASVFWASFFFGVILFKLLRQEGVELLWRDHVVQILVDVGHDPAPTGRALARLAPFFEQGKRKVQREWDEHGSGMTMYWFVLDCTLW